MTSPKVMGGGWVVAHKILVTSPETGLSIRELAWIKLNVDNGDWCGLEDVRFFLKLS